MATAEDPATARVRVRYRSEASPALLTSEKDGTVRVTLREPTAFVTPGQSAVFYDDDAVAGGGFIMKES